jgi:hypothetical protein
MTFNPDNLVYFYLILGLIAIPFAIIAFSKPSSRHDARQRHVK